VTLTHNCHNLFADAATVSPEIHSGLSSKGERMIRELNRMGMYVFPAAWYADTCGSLY
jgi:membrane dipeptidase